MFELNVDNQNEDIFQVTSEHIEALNDQGQGIMPVKFVDNFGNPEPHIAIMKLGKFQKL